MAANKPAAMDTRIGTGVYHTGKDPQIVWNPAWDWVSQPALAVVTVNRIRPKNFTARLPLSILALRTPGNGGPTEAAFVPKPRQE